MLAFKKEFFQASQKKILQYFMFLDFLSHDCHITERY